jgi:hypothetical protein
MIKIIFGRASPKKDASNAHKNKILFMVASFVSSPVSPTPPSAARPPTNKLSEHAKPLRSHSYESLSKIVSKKAR